MWPTKDSFLFRTSLTNVRGRSDVRGANAAGDRWTSVLVRTGVYGGGHLAPADTPDKIVDDVGQAVDWMLAEAGLIE